MLRTVGDGGRETPGMQQVSLSENTVFTGTGWRAMGAEEEGGVGRRGVSAAKTAEDSRGSRRDETRAENLGDPSGAIRVAQKSAGAHEEPA